MNEEPHVRTETLEAGLRGVESSPKQVSSLDLIVRRPGVGLRELPTAVRLDEASGLDGDGWKQRGGSKTADGSANPDAQLTVMNSRAIELIAGSRERWALAGDQLFADLDLSVTNLPAGPRLRVGSHSCRPSARARPCPEGRQECIP